MVPTAEPTWPPQFNFKTPSVGQARPAAQHVNNTGLDFSNQIATQLTSYRLASQLQAPSTFQGDNTHKHHPTPGRVQVTYCGVHVGLAYEYVQQTKAPVESATTRERPASPWSRKDLLFPAALPAWPGGVKKTELEYINLYTATRLLFTALKLCICTRTQALSSQLGRTRTLVLEFYHNQCSNTLTAHARTRPLSSQLQLASQLFLLCIAACV